MALLCCSDAPSTVMSAMSLANFGPWVNSQEIGLGAAEIVRWRNPPSMRPGWLRAARITRRS